MAENATEEEKKKGVTNCRKLYLADVKGVMNQENISVASFKEKVNAENMADLSLLIIKGELSSRMAKDILAEMYKTGLDPRNIIAKKGISQVTDERAIAKAIKEVLEENQKAAEDYKKGKENALQFLFGKTMAKLKGQGSPEAVKKVLGEELS